MLKTLIGLPRLLLIGLVRGYQIFISPLLPPSCRYTPTCSQYAILALRQYGVLKGSILAGYRILRCNPWGGHGHDPPRWFGEQLNNEKLSPVEHEEKHNLTNDQ